MVHGGEERRAGANNPLPPEPLHSFYRIQNSLPPAEGWQGVIDAHLGAFEVKFDRLMAERDAAERVQLPIETTLK